MSTQTASTLDQPVSRKDFIASLTPKETVAELDKFIVGQKQSQAGCGDCSAQPMAKPAVGRRHP